jgi:hypothetical protein
MHQRLKLTAVIAWFFCAAACLVALISVGTLLIQHGQSENTLKLAGDVIWTLYSVPFAITAALIVSRQPGNVIGWLLMSPVFLSIIGTPANNYINNVVAPPTSFGFPFLVMLWFTNWDWFPTGQPPTARWRWVLILAAGLCTTFLFGATFSKNLMSINAGWMVPNPIGFLDSVAIQTFVVPWQGGLIITVILCVASLFVRYRRARSVERKQIKWLLYACGVFAVIYIPGFWVTSTSNLIIANLGNLLFGLAIITFPASIAIAILNYRLWDIDILIRRTLIYGLLTAILVLFYFGIVVLLQQVFRLATSQGSDLAIAASTLVIAAMFNPLRLRLQGLIDRRFYRHKYDAARTLESFSAAARDEVELDNLSRELVNVVSETMQPESVSLWLKQKHEDGKTSEV